MRNPGMMLMAAALALTGGAAASHAAVLTFDQPGNLFTPYVESGFSVSDGDRFFAADGGSMHFDITGGPYSLFRDIVSVSGSAFKVTALDILSIFPTVATGGLVGGPRPDIAFTGYLGGKAVAWAWGSSQIGSNHFTFGSGFSSIDRLSIVGFNAGNIAPGVIDVHFKIDNLDVAPVPLPAAAGLALSALAGLGMVGLSRRRR